MAPRLCPRAPFPFHFSSKMAQNSKRGAKWSQKSGKRAAKNRCKNEYRKSTKSMPKGNHFGVIFSPFSIKNVIKNRCQNRCPKNMKFNRRSTPKRDQILHKFGNNFHEKTSFRKRVHVRKPHVLCSRIRVREGSPENEKIEN